MSRLQEIDKELKKVQKIDGVLNILRQYKGADRVLPIAEVVEEQKKERGEVKIIKTSIPGLDSIVGGFQSGQLIIISAPTGHGKTTMAKTLTKNFKENGVLSLWFSYEMPPIEFVESFPGVPYFFVPRELTTGTIKWVEEKILEGIAKWGTQVVFIDHLHFLIEMKDLAIAKNQSVLIGMLLRELKKIALRNNVIVFLIAHLRKIDTETELPTIDDLRDSSFVAQESDVVLLMWRKQIARSAHERREKTPPQWTNKSVVSVVKNRRTGKLGFVPMVYDSKKSEFFEEDPFSGTAIIQNNDINPEDIFRD